jgi:hypothetical protein
MTIEGFLAVMGFFIILAAFMVFIDRYGQYVPPGKKWKSLLF